MDRASCKGKGEYCACVHFSRSGLGAEVRWNSCQVNKNGWELMAGDSSCFGVQKIILVGDESCQGAGILIGGLHADNQDRTAVDRTARVNLVSR